MNEKRCKYCGGAFVPVHGNTGFCTDECAKQARKLRNFIRYNSINTLLPIMLANHELLQDLYGKGKLELTAQELESEGLDFSIFRRLYPDPNQPGLIRMDFGTYYLETGDNFQNFKLFIHETKTS
jgi:hypothetical protein